jgi:beta-glucosidase
LAERREWESFVKETFGVLAALSMLVAGMSAAAEPGIPLYKRADAPVEKRVRDLLGRMTLEEKVAQLWSNTTQPGEANAAGLFHNGQLEEPVAHRVLGQGLGTFMVWEIMNTPVARGVDQRNQIQTWILKNTRLGIPIMFHGEALHGAAVGGATSFPQAIALGSTWDPQLLKQAFDVVGREARAAGDPLVLAPVFDLGRDPRFGRIEEMYSEDPYLVGELGVAVVQGLQGSGSAAGTDHVLATAKHFVHGQPENGTNVGPSDFSERTMRGVFLAPFEKAVKRGRIGGVMPSYNENNGGVPSSINTWLLQDVLRKEWGFAGLTISDYGAVPRLHARSLVAASNDEAGIKTFNAGLDMELVTPVGYAHLAEAVRAGRVKPADLDAAVSRVLKAKFEAGLFEHPLVDPKRATEVVGNGEHGELARKVADEAMVLLKNDNGLLPLDPAKIRTLAVIGPNADKVRLGTYSGTPPYFVTVVEGVRKRVGAGMKVVYAEGVRISEPDAGPVQNRFLPYRPPSAEKDAQLIAQAVETAQAADAVVLVLGGNEAVSREAFRAEGGGPTSLGDTDTLELPGRQNELIRAIARLGKPVAAVVLGGRPYSLDTLSQGAGAILQGWYLGQETGNAVAGALFGDINPSGRLPVTIARNVGQLPVYYYRTPQARIGYVFDTDEPLYPFGYGLSYTTFTYGKPALDRASIANSGSARLTVSVTNTGQRGGDEVVQMYIHPRYSSVVQPIRRLAGFSRVHLEPGQTKTVSFEVGPEQLAIWDIRMKRTVEPGLVDVFVGRNVKQIESVQLEVTE